ncbi:MAG: T9SS type A sorting domain-containing protein [Fluviicola sp.]
MKYTNFFLMLVGSFSLQAQTSNPAPMFQDDVFIWSNSVYQSTAPVYAAEDKIYIANTVGSITDINPAVNQQFKAGDLIKINDAVISPNSSASAQFKIEKSQIQTAWYTDYNNVSKFYKVELGYKLPAFINSQVADFLADEVDGINPFDPSNIDLKVNFIAPNGQVRWNYGFYYQPIIEHIQGIPSDANYENYFSNDTTSFPWRVRFCPDQVGFWTAQLTVTLSDGSTLLSVPQTFYCSESDHRGYLERVAKSSGGYERWLRTSDDNKDFVTIGTNITSPGLAEIKPSMLKRHRLGLQKFIDAEGNFTRFDLAVFIPDWEDYNNYMPRMDLMAGLDKLVDMCEENNIYYGFFRHHTEFEHDPGYWGQVTDWQNNSYNLNFGITSLQFLQDQFAFDGTNTVNIRAWQLNCVRYYMSRWGFSANMGFNGFAELDKISEDFENDFETIDEALVPVYNWVADIDDYIYDHFDRKPYTDHGVASNDVNAYHPGNYSDIVAEHSYFSENKGKNWERFETIQEGYDYFQKPIYFQEIGQDSKYLATYCCTGIDYQNELWSTVMMGSMGTGMNWWWDRLIFEKNYQVDLKNVAAFFKNEEMINKNYHPERWDDIDGIGGTRVRKIENFHLVSENKEFALGWVHNATSYWRNQQSSCLENILTGNLSTNEPCRCAYDEHGYPYSAAPWDNPKEYWDIYLQENNSSISNATLDSQIDDAWSDEWGYNYNSTTFADEKMVIKNLKLNPLFDNHWYQVDFYEPTGPLTSNGDLVLAYTIVDHTNIYGRLNLDIELPMSHPSYAYKVTYLGDNSDYSGMVLNDTIGESTNQTIEDNTSREIESDTSATKDPIKIASSNLAEVYPNPSNNVFTVKTTKTMDKIVVYTITGQFLIEKMVNDIVFNLNLENFPPNNYVLDIRFTDGEYYTHKIQKL